VTIAFAVYVHILVASINGQIYDIWRQWMIYVGMENKIKQMGNTDPAFDTAQASL
jgi:hypothetical protein